MSDYMLQKADEQIEAGLSEKDELYKKLRERIIDNDNLLAKLSAAEKTIAEKDEKIKKIEEDYKKLKIICSKHERGVEILNKALGDAEDREIYLVKQCELKDIRIKELAASDTIKNAIEKITQLEQQVKDYGSEIERQVDLKYKLEQQLKEAESVIGFYADENNWREYSEIDRYYDSIKDAVIGGKIARAYLAKRETK